MVPSGGGYHGRMPEARSVRVVEYDPEWPRIFGELKERIWPAVREVAVAMEHVGSTSVEGMAAKAVIDVDIVIASRAELPLVMMRLGTLGYEHRGNQGIEDREVFKTGGQPAHHLYVCVENSLALRNHLTVRDYLRTHPLEAAAYSNLKKRLAERFANERERYQEGKTEFVVSILRRCGFSEEGLEAIRSVQRLA